jgi:hypothetical protein
MDLQSKLYKQFDEEGIKGIRRSGVSFSLEPGEPVHMEEHPNVFIPASEYYGLHKEILEELIIDYIYDTTSVKISSVQELDNLKSINGFPFLLQLDNHNYDEITYVLARRKIRGSVRINGTEITTLGNIEHIEGDLAFLGSSIQSLGKLKKVDGSLWIAQYNPFTMLTDLGDLEYVGRDLYLKSSPIKTLSNLLKVGGTLNLRNTSIQSFGKLCSVGNNIYLPSTYKGIVNLNGIKVWGKIRYYKN